MPVERSKLLKAGGLLKALWEDDARPSLRWLQRQQKRRTIPYVKIGHLTFFDPEQVRLALENNHTIKRR
jgi:hypothetical protein